MTDLPNIRLLILDVDGTLTDGGIYLGDDGSESKRFNAKDGLGIRRLIRSGVRVALLTGSINETIIAKRAEMLYVKLWYAGKGAKIDTFRKWISELGIEAENVAYIGDDMNDAEVMRSCGYSACPADAAPALLPIVDEVLQRNGGDACVREFIDRHYPDLFK